MNILTRRSGSVRLTVISLCSALLVGLFILVLQSGTAALAQASQPVTSPATTRADDSKPRRELAADLLAANNSIAELRNTLAKTNVALAQSRADLDKAKADLANAEAALKKANEDLANANAEVNSVRNAKISVVFYNGPNFQNLKDYFVREYTIDQLLKEAQKIPDICHVAWTSGGWSDNDDGIPRSVTIKAAK